MRRMHYTAILLSVTLLFSGAASFAVNPKVTTITLSQVPKSVYFGDKITVTGLLIEAGTKQGVAKAEVQIIDNRPAGEQVLASTKTRKYGYFTATWNAALDDPRDRTVHLVVKYDGSTDYTASVSREQTIMVKLLPLEITFQYLKSSYSNGESAEIIFSVTSRQKLIEPDVLHVSFNGKPVKVDVYGTGNYVYETGPLSKGHNQFFVNVSKYGYETVSRIITIDVN